MDRFSKIIHQFGKTLAARLFAARFRFVVSDSRRTPTARAVETLGYYDPKKKPMKFELDVAKAEEWIKKGAVPSNRVRAFIKRAKKTATA